MLYRYNITISCRFFFKRITQQIALISTNKICNDLKELKLLTLFMQQKRKHAKLFHSLPLFLNFLVCKFFIQFKSPRTNRNHKFKFEMGNKIHKKKKLQTLLKTSQDDHFYSILPGKKCYCKVSVNFNRFVTISVRLLI